MGQTMGRQKPLASLSVLLTMNLAKGAFKRLTPRFGLINLEPSKLAS